MKSIIASTSSWPWFCVEIRAENDSDRVIIGQMAEISKTWPVQIMGFARSDMGFDAMALGWNMKSEPQETPSASPQPEGKGLATPTSEDPKQGQEGASETATEGRQETPASEMPGDSI